MATEEPAFDVALLSRTAAARPGPDRRAFLRNCALGAGSLWLPSLVRADPCGWGPDRMGPRGSETEEAVRAGRRAAATPVRIRGVVRSGGRGLPSVGVSDGLAVTETAQDGSFELITSSDREFVFASIPAGYSIPQNQTGTARFYERIAPGTSGEMEASFDLQPLAVADDNHALLLLPDPQTEDAYEMRLLHEETVPDVQQSVLSLGDMEVFGIADGDIMFDNLELYPEYERAVKRMGVPFFQVVGNHDLDLETRTDEASTSTFSRHFGPRYYSFDRGAVHYVVLDDVFWHGRGYIGYIGADALAWLENDLARVEAGRPVVVAQHIPALGSLHTRTGERNPTESGAVTNRDALYRLLEPYEAHILTGHTHENEHVFEQGTHEHVSGAVCGGWWSGPICWDGTPSGYSVYEARGEQITWRYKSTGKPADHQLRVYPRGADPSAPTEIVANVWDWDPQWTVVWYENGERRGEMARRVGLDPLSVELHTGEDLPPRRGWVDPRPTNHLFYAPASRDAREIRVEATDRFGRSYSEVMAAGGSANGNAG